MANVQEIMKTAKFVILGDFNAPNINWDLPLDGQTLSSVETLLFNLVEESRAYQHVREPTRMLPDQRSSTLDLLFTHSP